MTEINAFAWLSLCSTIVCFTLSIVVYSFNRKANLNKLFFLTGLASFVYSFTTVMMWMSNSFDDAYLWHKMGTIWPFFVALVVNFALVYTNINWIKNKLNYLVLYLPAITFWLIDLFTDQINSQPIMNYWGYNDVASGSWVYYLSLVWTAALPILAFVLCFKHYRKAKDVTQKQQRKYIAFGFSIPIAAFIATNMITRALGIVLPNFGIIATLFFSIFVGYAVIKYDLFTLDAALAAENILSTIPDSLILADLDSKIIKVNERLVNFVGYPENELLNRSITELCADNEKNLCASIIAELNNKKIIRNHELNLKTKSGEKKNVLFSGSIVHSKTGRPIGLTCIIHDMTEIKEMEQRLLKAERLASIGELAGQIGHDLRNPLAGIKNGVYLIKKKKEKMLEEERQKILSWIEDAIEDSNRIVTSLVDYSSGLELRLEQCTPSTLTFNALSKLKVPDRINIINHSTNEIKMFIDAQRIETIFAGIIQNAIEATPEEGLIEISSSLKGANVEISFADSGTGIPETVFPKLFCPLVTTKAKGMGMSLAICKRIVDAHGGKVTAENVIGKGATFTFTLPVEFPKSKVIYP